MQLNVNDLAKAYSDKISQKYHFDQQFGRSGSVCPRQLGSPPYVTQHNAKPRLPPASNLEIIKCEPGGQRPQIGTLDNPKASNDTAMWQWKVIKKVKRGVEPELRWNERRGKQHSEHLRFLWCALSFFTLAEKSESMTSRWCRVLAPQRSQRLRNTQFFGFSRSRTKSSANQLASKDPLKPASLKRVCLGSSLTYLQKKNLTKQFFSRKYWMSRGIFLVQHAVHLPYSATREFLESTETKPCPISKVVKVWWKDVPCTAELNHLEPTWTSLNLSWNNACACEQLGNHFKFVETDLWSNEVGTNLEPNGTSLHGRAWRWIFVYFFAFLVFLDVVWPMS